MINIKDIENQIKQEVVKMTCEKYDVAEDEVKVTFKGSGDLSITITPKQFVEDILKAKVEVFKEER